MKKKIGYYLLILSIIPAAAALIYYLLWAKANFAMNAVVYGTLGAGIIVNVLLLVIDSDFLVVALTALYSSAMLQLLVDSAGSFADWYQGIVMFGDPTQVGAIITMAVLMLVGVVLAIVAGFAGRKKPIKA